MSQKAPHITRGQEDLCRSPDTHINIRFLCREMEVTGEVRWGDGKDRFICSLHFAVLDVQNVQGQMNSLGFFPPHTHR